VPCTTCVKRRQSQSCYYKRSGDVIPHNSATELLDRIRKLEDMLKQQILNTSQPSQGLSEPVSGSTPTWSDEASLNEQITSQERHQSGTVITSHLGHQTLSLRNSILDADLVHELVDSVPNVPSGTNFPFGSDSVNGKDVLLDKLPPLQQCEELKRVFFEVFSPVSLRITHCCNKF